MLLFYSTFVNLYFLTLSMHNKYISILSYYVYKIKLLTGKEVPLHLIYLYLLI